MIKNSLLVLGFILLVFGNPFGVLLLIPAAIVHLCHEFNPPKDPYNDLTINHYL